MSRGVFITGTDTDVGKTFVAVALLRALAQRGYRAVGLKPVASGCAERNGRKVCDDVERMRAAGNVPVTADQICPYAFSAPIAPHLAAARESVTIDLPNIVRCHNELAAHADWVVIEGAGGWRVPLNANATIADLARALGQPVILVVRTRLGCLNHAALSAEAIQRDGTVLLGWVANVMDPGMPSLSDNIDTLQKQLSAPLLAVFGHTMTADKAAGRIVNALGA